MTKQRTPKKTFAEQKAEAKVAVEHLHTTLAEKITSGEDWAEHLRFVSRLHNYSIGNTMLMWAQWEQRKQWVAAARAMQSVLLGRPIMAPLPEMSYAAGGSTWTGMDGTITKGTKALSVLAPFTITDHKNLDPITGKPRKRCIGFTLRNRTFDISQIEGVEAPPSPCTLLEGEGPEGLHDAMVRLAESQGFTVEHGPIEGSANGWCNHATKTIRIESANSPAQQAKTIVHEVGHLLMHGTDTPIGLSRAPKEIEAESVAFVVASLCGFDSSGYSLGYVATWSNGDGALIASTIERVVTTAARIVTYIESGVLPEAKPEKAPRPDSSTDAATAA